MEDKKSWKKPKKKTVVIVIAVLLIGVLVIKSLSGKADTVYQEVAVEQRDITSYLEFSGNVEAVNTANVYAEASANILEVLVEEGDMVKAGDVIATLDTSDVEYNIKLKELSLEQSKLSDSYSIKDSQSSLDNLNEQIAQGLNSSLNSAEKSLISAQESYLDAVETYNKTKEEYENGETSSVVSSRQTLITQQVSYENAEKKKNSGMMTEDEFRTYEVSYNNALENYENAKEEAREGVEDAYDAMLEALDSFERAQRDYDTTELSVEQSVKSYEDSLQKTKALADNTSSELELENLKESLADYTICAPIDGYITSLDLKAGDKTTSGKAVAEVTNFDVMQVAIKIDEYDRSSVNEGDAVEIYMDALGATYEGNISRISRIATVQNDVSYLEAIVEFAADDKVYSGLSAEVKLTKAALSQVVAVAAENISYDTDNSAYVLVKDEKGDAVKQPVTLGASDGVWMEITDGLEAGDVILVTPSVGMMMGGPQFPVE